MKRTISRVLGLAVAGGNLLGPSTGMASDVAPGAPEVRLKGRLLVDGVSQTASSAGPEGDDHLGLIRVRQAFLGLDAKFNDRLSLRFEGGAANNDAFVWDEAALEYRLSPGVLVSVGNLKAAALENLTSTRSIAFLERGPFGDLITDPFLASVQVRANRGPLAATLAIQGESFNNLGLDFGGGPSPGATDRLGATFRLAGATPLGDTRRLHAGAWARVRDFGDGAARAYAARPGTSAGRAGDWLGTGPLADRDFTVGIEGAYLADRFWVQGEAGYLKAGRGGSAPSGADPWVVAGYVYAGWSVSGEPRGYDSARALVTAPRISNPLSRGGAGAVDLLVRYDFADLTEVGRSATGAEALGAAGKAGVYQGLTLGAVWRPEPGYRLLLNLSQARVTNAPLQADVTLRLLQIRAQYDF